MTTSSKTNAKSGDLANALLLNAVDFLRKKIADGELTVGEYEALSRLLCENLPLLGTADDFAELFGKSKNNIRVVLCRKTDAKPIRKVLYPLAELLKAVPRSWIDK